MDLVLRSRAASTLVSPGSESVLKSWNDTTDRVRFHELATASCATVSHGIVPRTDTCAPLHSCKHIMQSRALVLRAICKLRRWQRVNATRKSRRSSPVSGPDDAAYEDRCPRDQDLACFQLLCIFFRDNLEPFRIFLGILFVGIMPVSLCKWNRYDTVVDKYLITRF